LESRPTIKAAPLLLQAQARIQAFKQASDMMGGAKEFHLA
jgi:hypothetical protein